MTTSSAAQYLNQCGLKATVTKVPLIAKTMRQLSEQGKTCIAMMRWKNTNAGHAYVFLGENQLGRFHFLDPDTPRRIRKFTPAELTEAARQRSSEVVGNELILIVDDADPVFTCGYCHSGKFRIPTYLPDESEFYILCNHCNRYNKITS